MSLCLQSVGNKNGKLWTTDEEVSPEVLAKVRGANVVYTMTVFSFSPIWISWIITSHILLIKTSSPIHYLLLQVQAIKLLVRWLLGMKNNQSKSANSTLRLLSAMLVSEGDLTEQKKIR